MACCEQEAQAQCAATVQSQTFSQQMQHVLKELTADPTNDSNTNSDFKHCPGDDCTATTDLAKYRDCI